MDSDPTPGNPEEIRELAGDLQEFADDVGEALGKIRGMASDRAVADWAGLSADAFRAEFDGVPENLTKLQTSYDMAADALARYWPRLENAQGMADRALESAIAAQDDLRAAQTELGDAQDWVSRAGDEAERLQDEDDAPEPPDEQAVRDAVRDHQAAEAAAGAAQSRVDAAEQRLAAARELAGQARELREEAARECARDIDAASDAGIQNRSWWEDAVNWVTENWDTFVDICKLVVAVLGIVVMIIGGPLAWVVLAAALVVLADTLVKYANGQATLWDVAFAALDCIPGMKGLTTLGGLAAGMRALARTGLRGLARGAVGAGRQLRSNAVEWGRRVFSRDPVDFATGEVAMPATDVELPGVLPLVLARHHLSTYTHGRLFGASWASTLDQRLVLEEGGVLFFSADGMILEYPVPLPDPDTPVLPVEGPRWGLAWDGEPDTPLTIHQPGTGHTLHFAQLPGNSCPVLPLTAITDRNGNRIAVHHDNNGAPIGIEHSGGYRIAVATYKGRITALRLASAPEEPLLVAYEYDDSGDLTKVYNSSGLPLIFQYDDKHRLIRWEDRNGTWYRYDYDANGRCMLGTGTDRALGYHYSYDPENHRTTCTNALGHATVYQFNDCYQLVAETGPLGATTLREWDRYDRPLSTTDALGRTTRYEYDDIGNVSVVVRPDGARIRAEYNELGMPTEITEADGGTWLQSYDSKGNRNAVVDPAGNRTRFVHDAHGGLASVTDALGTTTRVRTNVAGLPVAITDSRGETTHIHRDAFGRRERVVDPLGAETRLTWSVEGKPLSRTDPLGGEDTWEWDPEGNLLARTDAAGGTFRYSYGAFDLPVSQTGPDGVRYTFIRDAELRLRQVTDPEGRAWEYTYDDSGALSSQTDFDGHTTRYARDAAGQVLASTNAAGQSINYTYDILGRITGKSTSEGDDTSYSFNLTGQITQATSPGVELNRTYDAVGNLLTETVNGRTLRCTYDALGQLLTRITPSGHRSTWTYRGSGAPESLMTGRHTLTFAQDAAGRETTRHIGDELVLSQAWDPAGRLTGQTLSIAAEAADATARAVHQRRYTYRADGYLTAMNDPTGTAHFALDPVGRVISVEAPGWRERYTYNSVGNQTTAHWPTSAAHPEASGERTYTGTLLARSGSVHYEHDLVGRVTVRRKTRLSRKPEQWCYAWDAEGRLTQVTTPDGTVWRYRYDAFGRRTAKERLAADGTAVAERVDFVWHDGTLVEQTATSAGRPDTRTTLTWDHHRFDPVAQTETVHHEARQEEFDRRFYAVITDLVGTPTHLVTETGDTAWHGRATLWGVTMAATVGDQATTPLRFPGQYADDETGWHYNYHRHYDPATARYATPDPLGLAPAPNPYTYPHNPHVWTDPFGLAPYIRVSPDYQDWPTNGAHVHVGDREVRIFPDHLGGVGGEPIRLANGRVASQRDVQRALDEIADNPSFRQDIIDVATSVRARMNADNYGMSQNRALEIHFLIKALERM
ncbi:DUF6531 domain-containing protein [Streptomyces litchfieldiae]|uniref:RHS repeat-associated core domain-containing protein n=1 Tax=Streptomyces litchfieldiae TaxID=3075543 RepID=A0ABU2N3H0_9ACTN|nr:DUF6531 domain-containing protein [Streptomyces sp. DSM 44938]MDT0347603.1 RHS repeat-associated core domain-containing protein [Streptomyces sp. DSM 44938]